MIKYTEKNVKCVTCGKMALQTFTDKGAPICADCQGTKCFECCKSE